MFAAFENQDYPFEMLVEKLEPQRESNRNPLFDTMFVLQNFSTRRQFGLPDEKERTRFSKGWQDASKKAFTIYKGSGNHGTMLKPEAIEGNAKVLKQILAGITTKET